MATERVRRLQIANGLCEIETDKSERITANYARICLNNERSNESAVMRAGDTAAYL